MTHDLLCSFCSGTVRAGRLMPGEIQRYENRISGIGPTNPLPGGEGEWVKFTDHQAAVTAAVEERDQDWITRIEALVVLVVERNEEKSAFDRAAAKLIDGALRSLLPVREIPVMAGTLEALDRLCDVRGADAPAVTTGVSETTIPEGDENS